MNQTKIMERIDTYCRQKPGAYEARPFGETPICFKVMGKIFAQLNPVTGHYHVTLKCIPETGWEYREMYPGVVVRGYHCPPVQQPYWNTINLDEFSDINMLYQMIDEAYDAVIKKLKKKEKLQLDKLAGLRFKDTDGTDTDFVFLCTELDQTLDELVGKTFQRSQYAQYNLRNDIHDVIVVYNGEEAVACGSYKMFDKEHAELKRIYVAPSHRGMGVGMELIRRLEAKAKIQGFIYCILETGAPMVAAGRMYQKMGYRVITNYGQYADMPNSVCMERKI